MTRICSKTGQRTIIMDKGDGIRLQLKLPKCVIALQCLILTSQFKMKSFLTFKCLQALLFIFSLWVL